MKKFIITFLAVCMLFGCSVNSIAAPYKSHASDVTNQEINKWKKTLDEYDIELESVGYLCKDVNVIASYDSWEEFEKDLENTFSKTSQSSAINMSSLKNIASTGEKATIYSGSGNQRLIDLLTCDLYGTISYKYKYVNGKKNYTSINSISPYWKGVNIGYSFDLTYFYGTPITTGYYFSGGTFYYTPTSSSTVYFYQWGGNLKWGIEISGVLIGLSDYASGYSFGTSL